MLNYTVVVNKHKPLPLLFKRNIKLISCRSVFNSARKAEEQTLECFNALQEHLMKKGIKIGLLSAYRDFRYQAKLWLKSIKKHGIRAAAGTVALPGFSEHQTGLAIDLALCKDEKWITDNSLLLQCENEMTVIHREMADFGFILRYPKGCESITGYSYEPWHLRFVGVKAAKEISLRGITLEEYCANRN